MENRAGGGVSRGVFAREATGLVREFGTLDALIIASSAVFSLTYTILQFPWFYGFNQSASLPLSLALAAVPFAFLMLTYWAIGVLMPRSGNDYVWVSRVIHPALGFTWSALYMFSVFATAFVGGTAAYESAISTSLIVWGYLYGSHSLVNLGTQLSTPLYGFLLSVAIALVLAALAVVGARIVKAFLYVEWAIAAVGIVTICVLLVSANPATYAQKWDMVFSGYSTYDGLVALAAKNGWTQSSVTFYGSLAAIPFAALFLLGGNFLNAMAGEIRNVRRAIPVALFLSLVFGIVFWSVLAQLTLNAVGERWMYAVGYLWDNASTQYGGTVPFPPSFPLMVGLIAYPNKLLVGLVLFTIIAGSLVSPFVYFWIPARYFFAWSFDLVIPTRIASLNDRFKTPHVAIAIITALSIAVFALYWFTSWPTAETIGTFLWSFSFVVPGIATIVFPLRKKELFEAAPGWMGRRVAGVPLLSVLGLITTLLFGYIGYLALSNPLIVTPTTYGAIITLTVIVVCLATYYASKWYHGRRGLDISLTFKEIPPA